MTVMMMLFAHRTYKKAVIAVSGVITMRTIQDHARDLRIVWETLHGKPRLKA